MVFNLGRVGFIDSTAIVFHVCGLELKVLSFDVLIEGWYYIVSQYGNESDQHKQCWIFAHELMMICIDPRMDLKSHHPSHTTNSE
jgi:hypothetical protein